MSQQRYYSPAPRDSERQYDPTLRLERERMANDQKLKGRFERLFEKYSRDFSQVGDEVDLETGEIVVNNGHIALMEHERDVGNSASKQFVRAIEDELEEEDDDSNGEDEEGEGEDLHSGSDFMMDSDQEREDDTEEDELSLEPARSQRGRTSSSHTQTPGMGNREALDGDVVRPSLLNHLGLANPLAHPDQVDMEDSGQEEQPEENHLAEQGQLNTSVVHSTEESNNLPNIDLQDSLNALVPHQDQFGRIDPEAIHALGQNIANQIANFLTRYTTGDLNYQPSNPWSAPPLPRDAFVPPRYLDSRSAMTPLTRRYPSMAESPAAGQSLWAPEPNRGQRGPNKRRKQNSHIDGRLLIEDPNHPGRYEREDSEALSVDDSYRHSNRHPYGFGESLQTDGDFTDTGSRLRRGGRFRQEEDDLIKRLKEIDGLSWPEIARRVPGRSTTSVLQRYSRALKHLPRPVIVKREIIEIMDESELVDQNSPHYRLIARDMQPALPSPRRQPPTPLLRRALGNRIYDPMIIGDDDDETDGTPGLYPMPPPKRTPKQKVSKAKGTARPNGYHGKPESQTRYGRFDTTNPAGSFGMLRADDPVPIAAVSQQEHMLGPRSATTGAFGVLRVFKEKPKRVRKTRELVTQDVPVQNGMSQFQLNGARDSRSPHEGTPAPGTRAVDPRLEQLGHDADESDAPTATPYADVANPGHGGPYFLPQISRAATEDHNGLFMGTPQPINDTRRFPSSSPPLPTPTSDAPARSSQFGGAAHDLPPRHIALPRNALPPRNIAPPAPMYTMGHRSDALLAPLPGASASKPQVTARTYDEFFSQLKGGPATPTTTEKEVSQTRDVQGEDDASMPAQKQAPYPEVSLKRAMLIEDDEGSEDELA